MTNPIQSRLPLALLAATPVLLSGISLPDAQAQSASQKKIAAQKAARKAPVRLASSKATAARSVAAKPSTVTPNDRYLPMAQIKAWQRERATKNSVVAPALQPYWEGKALKVPAKDLLSNPMPDLGAKVRGADGKWRPVDQKLFAQAFPRPVAPASPSSFNRVSTVPRWVRYPLEFQLAGIGLGTKAVDKDNFNRIDRYGLFAIHGNPTAVVRAIQAPPSGTGINSGAIGTAPAPPGSGGAAISAGAVENRLSNLTLQQTPPDIATLFPGANQGGLPNWALAIAVQLDNNHVQWLYQRGTYSMGFVVDRLGFVDAIIVAGTSSPIAQTQLEDPVHTVQLGDDLRKVLFRYGYPDDIVPLAPDPPAIADSSTAQVGGSTARGAIAAAAQAATLAARVGAVEAARLGQEAGVNAARIGSNAAYRTYDLRYEQSYNVVFTIRNNRVVRIYIFGDPDFFNAQRRQLLRTRY